MKRESFSHLGVFHVLKIGCIKFVNTTSTLKHSLIVVLDRNKFTVYGHYMLVIGQDTKEHVPAAKRTFDRNGGELYNMVDSARSLAPPESDPSTSSARLVD
jgi:hypothetical protein